LHCQLVTQKVEAYFKLAKQIRKNRQCLVYVDDQVKFFPPKILAKLDSNFIKVFPIDDLIECALVPIGKMFYKFED